MKKSAVFGKTVNYYAMKNKDGMFSCIFPLKVYSKMFETFKEEGTKIVKVKMTVVDKSDETYYAWYNYDGELFCMIFKTLSELNCCFHRRGQKEIKNKKGEIVYLKIEEIEEEI